MNTEITDTRDGNAGARFFYDANCAFCTRWTARLRQPLERRGFAITPLQSPEARALLRVSEADLLNEMRVLTPTGQVLGGADAVVHLARFVWWGWPMLALIHVPGAKRLLRRVYRFVALHRSCLGGSCAITPANRPARSWINWLPLAVTSSAALLIGSYIPGWAWMWTLAFALFVGCKWLAFWKATGNWNLAPARTAGFLFAWPGMDAEAFLSPHRTARKPRLAEWLQTLANILAGSILIWAAARRCFPAHPLMTGWVGMVGLILILHFGLFHLVALAWRSAGVDATPLMREPIRSKSLGEFWGRRWNTGFHQLAEQFLFRPLHRFVDRRTAMLAVFLISGLVHDLVISLPAGGGYGLPTAYFLAQGAGVCFEHSRLGRRCGVGKGWRGRLFTLVVTVGPVFWLFHPTFISNVMLPFLKTLNAI